MSGHALILFIHVFRVLDSVHPWFTDNGRKGNSKEGAIQDQIVNRLQINLNNAPYNAHKHEQMFYVEVWSTFLSDQFCFTNDDKQINLKNAPYTCVIHMNTNTIVLCRGLVHFTQ